MTTFRERLEQHRKKGGLYYLNDHSVPWEHGEFACFASRLEPADPAPALTHCKRCNIENDGHYVQLDPNGHCGHCVADLMNGGPQEVPPQPAPMTRAARVLQGMERDPYLDGPLWDAPHPEDVGRRNEAARLRMAKWSLDRPLERDPKKWALLTGPCHPVTGRPVGRR